MQPEIDQNLERVIHQELRKLPPVKPPELLSLRVLATVRAHQALPWWRKSIWHWPNAVRTVFLIILAGLVAAITSSTWWAPEVAANYSGPLSFVATLGNACLVLWKTNLQNVVLFGLVFIAMLYLLCLGAGTIFVQLAVRRS
jgi:hypothetical protein